MNPMYYILEGDQVRPVGGIEWSEWFGTHVDERRIDHTKVGDVVVTTIFVGLNCNWSDGPPLLFETMIFGGDRDIDLRQWRYSTRPAAQAGHDRIVAALRARRRAGPPFGDLNP